MADLPHRYRFFSFAAAAMLKTLHNLRAHRLNRTNTSTKSTAYLWVAVHCFETRGCRVKGRGNKRKVGTRSVL